MIYLPWAVFLIAILWMIKEGNKAKKEYKARLKREEALSKSSDQADLEARSITHASTQGQASELVGALAGDRQKRIAGFMQQGKV
jgi:hypothetical protein